jgi:isocitrate dehydrogenase kinase/phosphatase
MHDATLAQRVAETILRGFDKHYRLFRELSASAKDRFERAAWADVDEARRMRIGYYDQRVTEAVEAVRAEFPDLPEQGALWHQIKLAYMPLLYEHRQPECAETFYNSVACRVLDRSYYRNDYIFWRPAISTEHIRSEQPTYRSYYPTTDGLPAVLAAMVKDVGLTRPWQDLERDLAAVAQRLEAETPTELDPNYQLQVLSSLFYRNRAAYLVGRAINGAQVQPFAVPILQTDDGLLYLDALLTQREDVGRLFSLARAYFMVDMEVPSAYVSFLRSLMPTKPAAELYTAVGLQKQGKTLFYRDLDEHLAHSTDRFVPAPGTRGMVMVVFTLPSFPYVFKVIRDWFDPPKEMTARHVRAQYLMVKQHDRVGRMADTLEYSDVAFPRERVDATVVEELLRYCPSMVSIQGDQLVIKHLYIERRMVPLDLWLADADDARARHTIAEYGNAIKELADADIFCGDLLLKNFGITRWGRVVFYDYDEIAPLRSIRFLELPRARDDQEEMAAEPWFAVGPHDVFPEQFAQFVFRAGRLRQLFLELHPDLVDAAAWRARQRRVAEGAYEEHRPYADARRLSVGS